MPTLCSKALAFTTWLTNSGMGRNKLTSLSIGKAIADSLQISSTAVTDTRMFFMTTHKLAAMGTVSKINEITLVDTDMIMRYVEAFYIWRTKVAYSFNIALCGDPNTVIEDFFGLNVYLDKDSIAELKKDPINAMKVYNDTSFLIRELNCPSE